MTEGTVSSTVAIDASPQRVYAMVSDLPRMGEWSPENTGGRWLGSPAGPAPGARFLGTNRNGRRVWPTTTVVTDATEPRRFAFTTKIGPVAAAEWAYEIRATEAGCEVTETWTDRRGPVLLRAGRVLTGVSDRVGHTREMIDATLGRLKAAAETTGDPS